MLSRILQTIILGVVFAICSTPQGMASEVIREDVRADFFVDAQDVEERGQNHLIGARNVENPEQEVLFYALNAENPEQDVLEDAQKQDFQDTMLYLFDEATLAEAESLVEGETSVEDSEEESRKQKRLASSVKFLSKCRILTGLSVKKMSKGVAKHPRTQDAQQERTAAIRFLQLAALAC